MSAVQPSAARSSRPNTRVVFDEPTSVLLHANVCTLDGFRSWALGDALPERARVAYMNGRVFLDMSNEEPESHVAVKGEITRALMDLNRSERLGKLYADGVLVTHPGAALSSNPDATFLSRQSIRDGRVRLIARKGKVGRYTEIEGSADMVLEVVSDASVTKDTVELRRAYHAAGVSEYWLVDARGEEIKFQILVRRKGRYTSCPNRGGWVHSPVFRRTFRLERTRDEFGLWEYSLYFKR